MALSLIEKMSRDSVPLVKLAAAPPTRGPVSTGLSKEHQEQGRVKRSVYTEYIRAASKTGIAFFVLFMLAQQALAVLGNLVLRSWAEANQNSGENVAIGKYLILYGVVTLCTALAGGGAAMIIWVFCSLRSARMLHDNVSHRLY
jgi:ATP-binding cassette, subfamily C (CFTR/MRP), member 1